MTILCNLEIPYWTWLFELQNQRGCGGGGGGSGAKKKKNLEKIKIKHLIYSLTSSSCVNRKNDLFHVPYWTMSLALTKKESSSKP
jgi:hypothetical protein